MDTNCYYHVFANGDEAKNLITCESDYYATFNLIGVCAASTNAKIVSFSIEDSHPHILMYGQKDDCTDFARMYETSVLHHIVETRGSSDGVNFKCDLYPVTNDDYLKNVAIYTIIQPTKDGKNILPFDYPWGTGSVYFRQPWMNTVWQMYPDGQTTTPIHVSSIPKKKLQAMLFSKRQIPDNWLICKGFLLPTNYLATDLFEGIFGTPNCYRVFLGNSSRKNESVLNRMAKVHGITLEDFDARKISESVCMSLFGKKTARWLDTNQRLALARKLYREYHMSIRQIAKLSRIPETELRNYLK